MRLTSRFMELQKRDKQRGTATQKLATHLLGRDVRDFIAERRGPGPRRRAWRLVARDLYEATDGQIDVTYETLRGWAEGVAA